MISNLQNRTFTQVQRTAQTMPSTQGKEAAVSSVPEAASQALADSASLSFEASPFSIRALNLLQATAEEAARLKDEGVGEHHPGELIVRTKPGLSLKGETSVAEDFGAKVLFEFDPDVNNIYKSESGEFLHLKLPHGLSTEEAMAALSADERVEFAVPNHIYHLPQVEQGEVPSGLSSGTDSNPGQVIPNDLKPELWGLHNTGQTGGKADADIDAPEAWTIHTGRNQVQGGPLIAVVDTGIDFTHTDLAANIWKNPGETKNGRDSDRNGVVDDIHGYNAFDNNGDVMDRNGHGTHVAGTIGAVGDNGQGVVGVNHNANIMAVKIFGDSGSTNAAAIVRGLQYSTKMGARITNNSWGGGAYNAAIKQAFAESPAMHFLSAGNNGRNNDTYDRYPGDYNLPNFIRVAATDHSDNLARFSNWAPTTVELGAPGVDILSTVPGQGYASYNGTSMATPQAAGAAALIVSAYPQISNEELKARLLGGVDQVPSLQGKTITGGRLNVYNSIKPSEAQVQAN